MKLAKRLICAAISATMVIGMCQFAFAGVAKKTLPEKYYAADNNVATIIEDGEEVANPAYRAATEFTGVWKEEHHVNNGKWGNFKGNISSENFGPGQCMVFYYDSPYSLEVTQMLLRVMPDGATMITSPFFGMGYGEQAGYFSIDELLWDPGNKFVQVPYEVWAKDFDPPNQSFETASDRPWLYVVNSSYRQISDLLGIPWEDDEDGNIVGGFSYPEDEKYITGLDVTIETYDTSAPAATDPPATTATTPPSSSGGGATGSFEMMAVLAFAALAGSAIFVSRKVRKAVK